MAVISFTADDGKPDQLESSAVIRVRRILDFERASHSANTKIFWSGESYAKETPAAFVALLEGVPNVTDWLGKLTMPDGSPVWFNGEQSEGPMRTAQGDMPSGANSALLIGGKLQYVSNSPQEVYDMVKAKHGKFLPVPRGSVLDVPLNTWYGVKDWISPYEVWDSEAPAS